MTEHISHNNLSGQAETGRSFLDEQEERAFQLGSYQAARDELPVVEQMIANGQAVDKRQAWAIIDARRTTSIEKARRLTESQRHFRIKRNHQIENSE